MRNDALMRNWKWPYWKSTTRKKFTPKTPIIFGKLEGHKNPVTINTNCKWKIKPNLWPGNIPKTLLQKTTTTTDISIISANQFIQQIAEYKPNPDDIIISLDVMSFYPSITREEMTNIINRKIDTENCDWDSKNTLQSATNLVLGEKLFKFNNPRYKQLEGIPMVSVICNVMAEWKMRTLQNIIRNDLKGVFRI